MLRKILGLVFVGIIANGCTALREKAYKDYSVGDLTLEQTSAYRVLVNELKTSPALIAEKCFAVPVAEADTAGCGEQRDEAISALIINSEKLCVDHRRSIYGNEAAWNIAAGSFTNLFSGAASVVGAKGTKSLLAALALFSNSERSLVNETIYKTALVQAIDSKIVQHRSELALALYHKFTTPINDYSATQALHELLLFHYSCSFMDGLRLALEEGTQERPKQKIQRLKDTLHSISLEMDTIQVGDRNGSKKTQFDSLTQRYSSVSKELQDLEKQ